MIIQGVCNEVEFSEDGLAPYSTSIEARRWAKRLIDAADRADGLLPDGIYRVTLPDYITSGVSHYRVVKDGAVLSPAGCESPGFWTIHERIGDTPEEGKA